METRDLILDKARFEDWENLYRNVWSRPETARHMLWTVTDSEEEARARMERTGRPYVLKTYTRKLSQRADNVRPYTPFFCNLNRNEEI